MKKSCRGHPAASTVQGEFGRSRVGTASAAALLSRMQLPQSLRTVGETMKWVAGSRASLSATRRNRSSIEAWTGNRSSAKCWLRLRSMAICTRRIEILRKADLIRMALVSILVALGSAHAASTEIQTAQLQIQREYQTRPGNFTDRAVPDIRTRLMPAPLRNKGCWFYMDPNGQGQRMRQIVTDFVPGSEGAALYHTITTRLGNTWNDKISSVQCDFDPNVYCYTTLYSEADFVGRSTTIRGDVSRVVNLTAATGWDNAVTSFRVVCSQRR